MEQLISGTVDTQKNSYRSIGQVNAGDDLELELTIQMNGQPIEFINPQAELLMKKADNNKVRQTKNILYQDGKFKIKVDEQGVTYPGIVTNQLVINDEGRVSTCLFYFNVGASLEREVLQSISKVETLEQLDEYVVTAFSNLDEYETRLIELDGTMRTTNEEITVNESERKANESERKTNETLRIENEKERVKKENERSEAEIDRKENELDRIKNENARRIAENTRIARENARENAEINRNAIFEENEAIRNEAEKLREKAEAKRKENFSNLESLNEKLNEDEAERVKAEGNRESKETERQLAEIAREKAEANRENTYTNFNDAEVDRRNNENARIQAENLRVQAESIRAERFEAAQSTRETKFEESQNTRDELFKASETARATEEIARERAESTREGNEVIRVNSESLRESAENTRQQEEIKRSQAEELRVEAEKEREISYEEIKKDNSTFKDEMKTDFGNAKTDYFGEEHLNVVDRLNSDFDNVHQRINDSSYLEYSGTNITADNSYYGLTKEMSIKGRTLQNLIVEDYKNQSIISNSELTRIKRHSAKLIKPNTTYTFIFNVLENTLLQPLRFSFDVGTCFINKNLVEAKVTGLIKVVITSSTEITNSVFILTTNLGGTEENKITYDVLLLEGDYTNTPIQELPFIDGIKSVAENEDNLIKYKSCGKNLIDINKFKSTLYNEVNIDGNTITVTGIKNKNFSSIYYPIDINLIKGKTIYLSCDELTHSNNIPNAIIQLDVINNNGTKSYFGLTISKLGSKFDIPNDIKSCNVCIYTNNTYDVTSYSIMAKNIQLTISEDKEEYEPYQESIQELELTEPLRSLPNGTCDEILEDGTEIRRVGKIVLDGSNFDLFSTGTYIENKCRWVIYKNSNIKNIINSLSISTICSDFNSISATDTWMCKAEGIAQNNSGNCIYLFLDKYSSSTDHVENKKLLVAELQANPITVYYELAEPIIIKHNKNINLKTFDGTTHMTSDNYLQPTLSCKVPSNVQAVVMSLKEENQELNNTITEMKTVHEEIELENIETNLDQDVRLTMLELGVI